LVVRLGPDGFRVTWLALGDDGGCGQPLPGFRVTPLGLGRARPACVWPGFRVSCLALVY